MVRIKKNIKMVRQIKSGLTKTKGKYKVVELIDEDSSVNTGQKSKIK